MPPTTRADPQDLLDRADNLPSVPGVAVEVLRLSRDEDAGIEDYAGAISRDPALAAKLLRLSNSSLFSMSQDVTHLEQAAMVLGTKTLRLMTLSFSLTGAVSRSATETALDLAGFWRRSLVASVAGRSFCRLLGLRSGDEAFMCGLLSNIGQLAMAQCIPDDYAALLAACGDWPTGEEEREHLGYDHAALGGTLLRSWELPAIICDVVAHLEDPDGLSEDAPEATRELTRVMCMAGLAARVLCDREKGEALAELQRLTSERGLPENQVTEFLVRLETDIREAADLFDLELEPGRDYASIVEEARMQMVHLSLGTAASLQRTERRAAHLENENRTLAAQASTDRLTGIANRLGFDSVMEKELASRREPAVPHSLGLLMLDVDRFKAFNDTYGHQAGDQVLRIVGRVMKELVRETDMPARYGGEEFAVIVPRTSPFALRCFAERIRKTVEETPLPVGGETVRITVSIGGACLERAGDPEATGRALIEAADHCLYRCKEGGRNRVEVEPDPLTFTDR